MDDSGGTELIASQDGRGGGTEFFASQGEPHEEDADDQATAEEGDGRPTHSTHTHVTHTYMQDARKAVEEPVHPPTPAPHHTHTTPNTPLLTPPLNQSPILHAAWDYGENAENAQEKAGDRGVRMGGDVEDSGGTELIASQDERGGGTESFAS